MAKKSRRPVRPQQRVRTKPTLSEGRVRVSLATSPQAGDNALEHDVELAKSALLYADEVEMVGLHVALFEKLRQVTAGDLGMFGLMLALDDEALGYVMGASGRTMPSNFRETMRLFAKPELRALAKTASGPESQELQAALDGLDEINAGARPFVANILEEAGAAELATAIDARVIRVAELGVDVSGMFRTAESRSRESDTQIATWVAVLLDRLQDRSTRLLFDEASAELVQDLIADGRLKATDPNLRLARQAALGAGLIARLPAFPQARMDELLDLRQDLAVPLIRYRGAVVGYSKQIPNVLGQDLEFEISQLWEEQVAPAVQEVEQRLADHPLVRELARSVDAKDLMRFIYTSTASVVAAQATDVRALLLGTVAASAHLGVPATIEAVRRRGHELRDVRGHELYYLFETNRQLAS